MSRALITLALKRYSIINCFRGEIQNHLSWKRCKSWRVADPEYVPEASTTWSDRHLPLLLPSTPAGREAGIRATRLGSVSIAPRRVFRARDTSTPDSEIVSRYPSSSVEWRASRCVNPDRPKVSGVSRSAGTDERTAGTRPSALSVCRFLIDNSS